MGNNLDLVLGKIPAQHRPRPWRRRNDESGASEQRAMPLTPRLDIDVFEFRLQGEAMTTHRAIGDAAAVGLFLVQERDRRAGEVEIVHRIAIGNTALGQRAHQPVAASGNIVQVNELDAKACA